MVNTPSVGLDVEIDSIRFGYSKDDPIFTDFTVRFPAGKRTVLLGRSGCGKSTLLSLIALLEIPECGHVRWDGVETETWKDKRNSEERNHQVGFVFQDFLLDPLLSAAENVALPLRFSRTARLARRRRKKAAVEALERVGLKALTDRPPTELSGGQNQRVAIARALVSQPRILLVDEPTSALDSGNSAVILGLLDEINRTSATTVVISTHDTTVVDHADQVIHLETIQNQTQPAAG